MNFVVPRGKQITLENLQDLLKANGYDCDLQFTASIEIDDQTYNLENLNIEVH